MSNRWMVVDTFSVTGRGTVVLLDGLLNLPAGGITIRVSPPDGSVFECNGYPEFVLRRAPRPVETTGILVRGLSKDRLPVGSSVEILIPDARSQ